MAQQFSVRVDVSHLPGILDPQGVTVERALPALGYDNVSDVRLGKTVHLTIEADDAAAAEAQVDEMCRKLLANPVIEAYTITIDALANA
jgi:phosphoribosylformylglycinamidine synthase PurS subunit